MLKELKIAFSKGQTVSIQTKDGENEIGVIEETNLAGKVKLRNETGILYITYEDISHVMRLIPFPVNNS